MKRYAMLVGLVVSCAAFSLVTGCRAFNSAYSNPEADVAAKPRKVDPAESKPKDPKKPEPAGNAPIVPEVDYSKDTTNCETPKTVTIDKNGDPIIANSLWAANAECETATVTATKRGDHSADIVVTKTQGGWGICTQKFDASYPRTLSFTVKQTSGATFAACNFKYTEGDSRVYEGVSGTLMIDRVNAVSEKTKPATITNSGAFNLTFTRAAEVTKAQAVLLGSAASGDLAGILLEGTYFSDSIGETSRFDAEGNIVGVTGTPYVPKSK